MQDLQILLEKALPGILGSGGATLFWLKGGWKRRVGMWVFGGIVAYYLGTSLATWLQVSGALTGLTVGLFSMAIIDRIFNAIERFDFADLFNRIIDKFLGRR